ncbi:MAG: hypothetical protein OIF50_08065, partial [Flavobacteriaceae bacterium]|nr:hypothetical protein [Flavobacteriaceae bacterium]
MTGIFWDDTKYDNETYAWIITNGYKGITLGKTTKTGKLSKILYRSGFQNTYESFPDFVDNAPNQIFYLDSLKPSGKYMTTIKEHHLNTKYNIAKLLFVDNFDLRDGYYITGRNWDISISKKFSPPYSFGVFNSEVWQDLMTHSKTDSRNYLSEFLELDIRAVKSKIADVFSKPRYVVNRLPQGTVVRVLGVEQKGGLVPVEYYANDTKVDT